MNVYEIIWIEPHSGAPQIWRNFLSFVISLIELGKNSCVTSPSGRHDAHVTSV